MLHIYIYLYIYITAPVTLLKNINGDYFHFILPQEQCNDSMGFHLEICCGLVLSSFTFCKVLNKIKPYAKYECFEPLQQQRKWNVNSFLWKQLGKVWNVGSGWVLLPVCLPDQTHNCTRLRNALSCVTCGHLHREDFQEGSNKEKIKNKNPQFTHKIILFLWKLKSAPQFLWRAAVVTRTGRSWKDPDCSLRETWRCLVNKSEADQPQSLARARKGPGEGDWEKNLGLDKMLTGRTGTCQGGTKAPGQKRRASLGARWSVGINKRWNKGR